MNKEIIYEEFFDAISESLEWGLGNDEKVYSSFIDGLCSMTHRLLDKLGENEDENSKSIGLSLDYNIGGFRLEF